MGKKEPNHRILVIGPNGAPMRRLCAMLRRIDAIHEFFKAETVEDAGWIIANKNPDAVLLDPMLAQAPGIPTLLKIRKQASSIPVIIVSPGDQAIASRAMRMGADDFIPKEQVCAPIIARTIQYSIDQLDLHTQLNKQKTQLENCQGEYRRLQGAIHQVVHDMAQPLQVLGNSLELLAIDKSGDESFQLSRRMVSRISELLKSFRQTC